MLSCGIFCCRLWLKVYEKRFFCESVKIYSLQLFLPHLGSNCRTEFSQNRMIVSFAGAGAQTLPTSWGCRKKKRNLPFFPVGMTRNTSESWNIQILAGFNLRLQNKTHKNLLCFVTKSHLAKWGGRRGGRPRSGSGCSSTGGFETMGLPGREGGRGPPSKHLKV